MKRTTLDERQNCRCPFTLRLLCARKFSYFYSYSVLLFIVYICLFIVLYILKHINNQRVLWNCWRLWRYFSRYLQYCMHYKVYYCLNNHSKFSLTKNGWFNMMDTKKTRDNNSSSRASAKKETNHTYCFFTILINK